MKAVGAKLGFSAGRVKMCVPGDSGITGGRELFAFMRRYKIVAVTNIGLPTSKYFGNKVFRFFSGRLRGLNKTEALSEPGENASYP